ncbi:hypothetical protein GZH46_00333, partial [Fragariocoptes setiger]
MASLFIEICLSVIPHRSLAAFTIASFCFYLANAVSNHTSSSGPVADLKADQDLGSIGLPTREDATYEFLLHLDDAGILFDRKGGSGLSLKSLSSESRMQLKRQVLNVLGLEKEPRPNRPSKDLQSGTNYVKELYKRFYDQNSGRMKVTQAHDNKLDDETLDESILDAIDKSNTIVSFNNLCKYIFSTY